MNESKPIRVGVSWWLVATALHLSGVIAFGVASYLDRHGKSSTGIAEPLAYWGLLTLLVGPGSILALIIQRLVTGWQIPIAIVIACAIEFTAYFAMLPLIQ